MDKNNQKNFGFENQCGLTTDRPSSGYKTVLMAISLLLTRLSDSYFMSLFVFAHLLTSTNARHSIPYSTGNIVMLV